MASRLKERVQEAHKVYRSRGAGILAKAAVRFGRVRLPNELWPPLLHAPRSYADEKVEIQNVNSVTVKYDGRFKKNLPRQLRNFEGEVTSPEGIVYVFSDVKVTGCYPLARVDGKYLLASWFGVDTPFFTHQNRHLRRTLPLSRIISDHLLKKDSDQYINTGFLLLSERGKGYHHWFYEVLPKLWWLEKYQEAAGETPTLIVHSPLQSFQRKSLQYMGYEPDTWIEHGRETSQVGKLVVAPHPIRLKGNQLQALPTQLKWVGNKILSNIPQTDKDFADRIYISRADADRRQVRNEDEVVKMLNEMGFKRYEPGRLTMEDQARLFSGARVIVGPHGLAYTNLIYANDASLIELFPEGGATETYFAAANELDLSYEFMSCEAIDSGKNIRPRDKDLYVDVTRLQNLVERIVEDGKD